MSDCTTLGCENPGTVWGTFSMEDEAAQHVLYCPPCASYMWSDGIFIPDNDLDLVDLARTLCAKEQATVDRFESSPPAPESFDAVGACRRVMRLADELERDGERRVATWIREAVAGVTA